MVSLFKPQAPLLRMGLSSWLFAAAWGGWMDPPSDLTPSRSPLAPLPVTTSSPSPLMDTITEQILICLLLENGRGCFANPAAPGNLKSSFQRLLSALTLTPLPPNSVVEKIEVPAETEAGGRA